MSRRSTAAPTCAVAALALLLAWCSTGCSPNDDPTADPETGAAPATSADAPYVRESRQPQTLDRRTALQACATDEAAATRRVASVVLPVDYQPYALPYDTVLDREAAEQSATEDTCVWSVLGRGDSERRGESSFAVTLASARSLEEVARAETRGTKATPEVGRATVLGDADGLRGEWTVRDDYLRESYDVVALQTDGLRLTWVSPGDATAAQQAAGAQRWQRLLDTLAVRPAAARDGDDDAESDTGPPTEDTTSLISVTPTTSPGPGAAGLSCRGGGATARVVVPERLAGGRDCYADRTGPDAYAVESISIEVGVDETLAQAYEEALRFEALGGDDATSDLEYDADTDGPGDLPVESLVLVYANDGRPLESHAVQAGGTRITWTVRPDAWGPQADELPAVLDSLWVRTG